MSNLVHDGINLQLAFVYVVWISRHTVMWYVAKKHQYVVYVNRCLVNFSSLKLKNYQAIYFNVYNLQPYIPNQL